jgi:hypothetical protein
MTNELKELKQHIQWLEDECRDAVAVEDRLNEIDDRLDGINDGISKLVNAFNGIVDNFNRIADGLREVLTPKSPPSPSNPACDILDATIPT